MDRGSVLGVQPHRSCCTAGGRPDQPDEPSGVTQTAQQAGPGPVLRPEFGSWPRHARPRGSAGGEGQLGGPTQARGRPGHARGRWEV